MKKARVEDELGRLWWVWPEDPAGPVVGRLQQWFDWIVLPRTVLRGREYERLMDNTDKLQEAFEQTGSEQLGRAFARRLRLFECIRLGGINGEHTEEADRPDQGEPAHAGLPGLG